MAHPNYTPQFEQYCKNYFTKCIPFGLATNPADFNPANTEKLFEDLDSCTQLQLQFIKDFAKTAKANFNRMYANAVLNNEEAEQKAVFTKFFKDLDEKLKDCSKTMNKKGSSAGSQGQGQESPSSFKPSAQTGQSFYDSMMHILGYDATTVGASAIFFLAFSALRFLAGSPYWEQMAEYHYNPAKQFKPNALTEDQIALNLHKDSTRDEIMQAGFLPPPDLASAFNVEFQTFMNKMGKMTKMQDNNLNQLGANLLRPRR